MAAIATESEKDILVEIAKIDILLRTAHPDRSVDHALLNYNYNL